MEKSSLHAGCFDEGWSAQIEAETFDSFTERTVTESEVAAANNPPIHAPSQKRKGDHAAADHAIDEAALKIMQRMEAVRSSAQSSTQVDTTAIGARPSTGRAEGNWRSAGRNKPHPGR